MWSQYLPIWYADIPRETFFVVIRTYRMPWQPLAFTVLALVWVIPFTFLMGRRPKMTPTILGPVCVLGLVGMWLERYVLVTPSLSGQTIPLGWIELFLTAGFIALFGICTGYGLRLVPPLASPPEAVE
jgi:hypothetical protein